MPRAWRARDRPGVTGKRRVRFGDPPLSLWVNVSRQPLTSLTWAGRGRLAHNPRRLAWLMNPWRRRRHKDKRMANTSTRIVLILLLLLAGVAGIVIYSGVYNVGADVPHSRLVYGLLEQVQERSVANHARSISVPRDLNDPKRISAGAGLYAEMCAGCHLGPGIEPTEISRGLYPSAPELARGDDLSAAEQFWTIKHGIKSTAMPAWGKTHNDELIWDMVAFVRQL